MSRGPRASDAGQRGQAITEFLVVCLVLLPLLGAIVVIGRYEDLARATDMASRYAAFAATRGDTLPDLGSVGAEVRTLFFAPTATPFTGVTVRTSSPATRPFWVDQVNHALLGDVRESVRVGPGSGTASSGSALDSSVGTAAFLPVATLMRLPEAGLYSVHVQVSVAPAWMRTDSKTQDVVPALTLRRSAGVLIGSWRAHDATQVTQIVETDPMIFPATELRGLADALDPLVMAVENPGIVRGPQLGALEKWVRLVPVDREAGGHP